MLFLSVVALVIAYLLPQGKLFWVTYFAGTLFASSWGPVAFMSVWSKRITEAGAFWGIIAGLLGNIVTNTLALLNVIDLPVILDPILVGVVVSYITVELVSRYSTVSAEEHALRERLHRIPPDEIDRERLSRTLLWPKILIVAGIILSVLMVFFYAMPYREASGESAIGEVVFSLGVGMSLVITGALAWWGTARSYRVT